MFKKLTTNHYPLITLLAFFAATAANAVTITANATAVGAGDNTPVTATVSDGSVDSLSLVYRVTGSADIQPTWNTNDMVQVDASYVGYLPALPGAVTIEWFVTDGETSTAMLSTTLSATIDYDRYHDGVLVASSVNGWQRKMDDENIAAGASNFYAVATSDGKTWEASGIATATKNTGGYDFISAVPDIGMQYPVIYFHNLPPSSMPFIRSPKLTGGVGTIDFRSKLIGATIRTSQLTVQKAYSEAEPTESEWINVEVYNYGLNHGSANGSGFAKINHIVLNDSNITYIRILRTDYNIYNTEITAGRLSIDNICISKPPANVVIKDKLMNPGYPAKDQDVKIRCSITNVTDATPAINRRVTVKYQYVAREDAEPNPLNYAWSSTNMVYMGRDNNNVDWYEGLIPAQKTGYVWYYYQVDFDGYNYGVNPQTGVSEGLSPAYFDGGCTINKKGPHASDFQSYARYQVRPNRSRYSTMTFTATKTKADGTTDIVSEPMTLVDDEQWQRATEVGGYATISNRFEGAGYYVDDADAYSPDVVYFGDNNPSTISDPTLAGGLEKTNEINNVEALVATNEKKHKGFFLYRFNSDDFRDVEDESNRYDYIVKKAVYNDFDEWTATPDYYESSLGGLPTISYAENFDGNAASVKSGAVCTPNVWASSTYGVNINAASENFDGPSETVSDVFDTDDIDTAYHFLRTGSRLIQDRDTKTSEPNHPDPNKTVALQLGGKVQNTSKALSDGLEKLTFKARASLSDDKFVLNTSETSRQLVNGSVNGLYFSTTFELTSAAPSKHYLSFILLYSIDLGGNAKWYEVRIIQADCTTANDNTVACELWRHDANGTTTKVAGPVTKTGGSYKLSVSTKYNIYAYNDSGKLHVKISQASANPSSSPAFDLKDSTAGAMPAATAAGTFGFGVFDAVPNITVFTAGTTFGGTTIVPSISSTAANWYTNLDKWTVNSAITRKLEAQTIEIYAADRVGGETRAENSRIPAVPLATREVGTLSVSDFAVDVKAWNEKFVIIKFAGGNGGIVLDDIVLWPWRAQSLYKDDESEEPTNVKKAQLHGDGLLYNEWISQMEQTEWLEEVPDKWGVLEGWVTQSGTSKGLQLERTRANPALVQGVVSPTIGNGLGSINFSYATSGGKVVYGVERCTEPISENEWVPVRVYCDNVATNSQHYEKIGKFDAGRVRVRVYGQDDIQDLKDREDANAPCGYEDSWGYTDPTAMLTLDNLKVKDYPVDVNTNAWKAYNLLITDEVPAGTAPKSDGYIYNNTGKSCFFNNSATDGVYGDEQFDEDDPYLQSPPLRDENGVEGVGEIAFQYRIVTPDGHAAAAPGHIIVKAAADPDTPAENWVTITNIEVAADGDYVKFDDPKIYKEDYCVVRFYNSKLPNTPRVVIDNVLVTAPARAEYSYDYVKILPVQPLVGSNVTVEAKLKSLILNPQQIRVFCSYHKYDPAVNGEQWGIKNWFNPLETANRIELNRVDSENHIYRTAPGEGIPAAGFAVDDMVEFVVWGTHAEISLSNGDSPIIQSKDTFSIPSWYETYDKDNDERRPVDQNEIKKSEGWSPYYWVYSCPPGTFFVNEISQWYSKSITWDKAEPEYIEFVAPVGTDISGWVLELFGTSLGDSGELHEDIPAGTKISSDNSSNGWGFFMWGDSWAADDNRFDVDIAFPNSSVKNTENIGTYGYILAYRSNGMVEQMITFGPLDYDWKEDDPDNNPNRWTWANRKTRNTDKAKYALSLISREDSEYHEIAGKSVSDFKWSIATEPTPGGVNGESQIFADIGGGEVAELFDPMGNKITAKDVLAWLESFNAKQSDIDALGKNQAGLDKFNEEFLFNLDITKYTEATLKITGITVEEGVVCLGVSLERIEGDDAVAKGRKINGVLKLMAAETLTGASPFSVRSDAAIGDSAFEYDNITSAEYTLPAQNPPKFFKLIIEPPAAE